MRNPFLVSTFRRFPDDAKSMEAYPYMLGVSNAERNMPRESLEDLLKPKLLLPRHENLRQDS